MTEAKLAMLNELSQQIKDIKLKKEIFGSLARGEFQSIKTKALHPDFRPQSSVKVTVEYSDGHFGQKIQLDIPDAYAILAACEMLAKQKQTELEQQFGKL